MRPHLTQRKGGEDLGVVTWVVYHLLGKTGWATVAVNGTP